MSIFGKKKQQNTEPPRVWREPQGGKPERTGAAGFEFAEPKLLLPSDLKERRLDRYFGTELRRNCEGYYTLACKPFADLYCTVGFHFEKGVFSKLDFFRDRKYFEENGGKGTVASSFEEFQRCFEREFGKPHECAEGAGGKNFPDSKWIFEHFEIRHWVISRFGGLNESLEWTVAR